MGLGMPIPKEVMAVLDDTKLNMERMTATLEEVRDLLQELVNQGREG